MQERALRKAPHGPAKGVGLRRERSGAMGAEDTQVPGLNWAPTRTPEEAVFKWTEAEGANG